MNLEKTELIYTKEINMKINRKEFVSHHYMTPEGIVLGIHGKGKGDSLGRTALASLVYDEDEDELIAGAKSFFLYHKDKMYVVRYPHGDKTGFVEGNSRDHVINMIGSMAQLNQWGWISNYLKYKAGNPSVNIPWTPDQRLWLLSIRSHVWSWIYLLIEVLWLGAVYWYNGFMRLCAGTLKTYTLEKFLEKYPDGDGPKKGNWFAKNLVHLFSFYYTMNGSYAIHSKTVQKILRWLLGFHFEKTNYVPRMKCGRKIELPEIYMPTRSNRWSIRLDDGCNRDMRVFADPLESSLELAQFIKQLEYHTKFVY